MFGKKDPAQLLMDGFTAELDRRQIRYSTNAEKKIVSCKYDGDHFKDQSFTFFFDDDGESFSVRAYSIEQFTKNQLDDAYAFCNTVNADYRWITFYVDSDDELTARADSIANPKTIGARGYELLSRIVRITDGVCEKLYS